MAIKGSKILCAHNGYIFDNYGNQLGETKADVKMVLDWSATQSISGNYSDIVATITLYCNPVYRDDGTDLNYCFRVNHRNEVLDTHNDIDFTNVNDLESIIGNGKYYLLWDRFQQLLITDVDTNQFAFARFSGTSLSSDMSWFGYRPYQTKIAEVQFRVPHNLDGTKTIKISTIASFLLSVEGLYYYRIPNIQNNCVQVDTIELDTIPRQTDILTATNFTDEENPVITYNAQGNIKTLQAAISFDGSTPDVAYRNISAQSVTYTFNLTTAERDKLRAKVQGATSAPIYFLLKTERTDGTQTQAFISKAKRTITIVGCNPSANPVVKDIKEETLALTGDANSFVRYESMAEYTINATASKGASIVKQSVQCGSKLIENLPQGVIDNVESGTFNFYVLDSRNMAASTNVFKKLIEYIKPTCNQKLEIELSGETTAQIKLTISGNYYNGSFGAVNNELQLQVRYSNDSGTMGDWQAVNGTPTYNGNTYKLDILFNGFNYGKAYDFQCRAIDKLNTVITSQYTIRLLPVFDWSETDFNFNVPVNVNADSINMHNETIIRHNETANNTVLSATGGHIYLRPAGTDSTSGETIIYPNGDIKFGGAVTFADGSTSTTSAADYVVESGSAVMGSNGTWYWHKWASGKAECWGCRNFGSMAVNTAWGNLYRSAIFTQDLPSGVFKTTPDVININIVNGSFGGWICKHENTAPSAVTTGSFIYVRPASAQVSPSYIGFHVIGVWK